MQSLTITVSTVVRVYFSDVLDKLRAYDDPFDSVDILVCQLFTLHIHTILSKKNFLCNNMVVWYTSILTKLFATDHFIRYE